MSSGCALIVTPWLWSSFASWSVFANAGISVLKCDVGLAFFASGGYLTAFENDPWMAVPFEVISTTLFARTCSRKVGLYGTRTRRTSLFTTARETKKLIANSASTNRSRRQPGRWNFGGCGALAPPPGGPERAAGVGGTRPSIAASRTRERPRSVTGWTPAEGGREWRLQPSG